MTDNVVKPVLNLASIGINKIELFSCPYLAPQCKDVFLVLLLSAVNTKMKDKHAFHESGKYERERNH